MLKSFILNSRGRQGESLDGGTADSDSLAVNETAFTPGSMPSFGGDSRTAPTRGEALGISRTDSIPSPNTDSAPSVVRTALTDSASTGGTVSGGTTTISAGATLELNSPFSGTVSFATSSGTLKIDNSSNFGGSIAGQLAVGDVIDLADVNFSSNTTIHYSGNNSSGTLTVSDGVHTASVALQGNYSLANFTTMSDGHGGTSVVDPPSPVGTGLDANGWTTFTPSANARIIYVSSSTGSDSNTGLSPNSPLKTIAAGLSLLRNNSDDELLLKAGDTWHESISWPNVSGMSATNPIVISSYGTGPRPVIDSGTQDGLDIEGGGGVSSISNIAIDGLNFYAGGRDPNSPEYVSGATSDPTGINDLITGSNILIEDTEVSFYKDNIVLEAPLTNVSLRRDIILNSYSTDAHSQGLYSDEVTNLVLDGNVFDHNGWNASVPGASPTIFNHNIYIQSTNGPATLIDNISANASSHGAQVRNGGIVTDNLFVHDPIGLLVAGSASTVSGNVVTESNDIDSADPRGFGIDINPTTSGAIQVTNNIITHEASTAGDGFGISLEPGTTGDTVQNNIIYQWDSPVVDSGSGNTTSPNAVNQSGYVSPNRTVESYYASLGGSASLSAFLAAVESQSKSNWNPALTADAVDSYIEAGFSAASSGSGPTLSSSGPTTSSSRPTLSSIADSPSTGDLNAGKTVTLTLNMSSAVTVAGGTPTLTLNDGGVATYAGGSGTSALTFSYTVGAGDTNVASLAATAVNLNGATIKDSSGNAASLSLGGLTQTGPQIGTNTAAVDTTSPTISSVAATSGNYNTGKTLTLTLNMSEAVTVSGSPTLTLNDGGTATYAGGSGGSALTFTYTVASGQNTAGLAVTAVNGTITDLAGNALSSATLPQNFTGVAVDTTTPSVSSVVASGSGITAGSGDVGIGSVVTLTVNLSEAVRVAGGTPTLTLNDGGTASYTGGSGSNALTFSYAVAAGQNTADLAVTAVNLNSASVKNGAGTAANLTGAVTNPAGTLQINTSTPVVSTNSGAVTTPAGTLQIGTTASQVAQVVTSPSTGKMTTGHAMFITLDMSDAVAVTGTPTLLLNDGGSATYDATRSTAKALVFDYTVGSRQVTTDLKVVGFMLPTGSSIRDLAGNNAVLAGAGVDLGLQINTTKRGIAGTRGNNPTIAKNAELELFGASKANVTFSGGNSELKLDDSLAFTGRISGLTGSDALDLSDVSYGANTKASFSGSTYGGTLTVTDGSNTAKIALRGNYLSSGWTLSSDGNGGTSVVDPPLFATFPSTGGNQNVGEDIFAQRLALLVQHMASSFATSGVSEGGISPAGHIDNANNWNSLLAQPIQQHSQYA